MTNARLSQIGMSQNPKKPKINVFDPKDDIGIDDEICAICTEPYGELRDVITINCNHVYHLKCILKWMFVHHGKTCPLCRAEIVKILYQNSEYTCQQLFTLKVDVDINGRPTHFVNATMRAIVNNPSLMTHLTVRIFAKYEDELGFDDSLYDQIKRL